MDTTDGKILSILQRDGRITMKALAQQINMSVPSAAERVRRLEEQRVILGYQAILDARALGREIETVILAAARPQCEEQLRDFVRDCPDIIEAWDLAGRVGLLLRISCRDMPAFQELVTKMQKFSTTESYLYLHHLKCGKIPVEIFSE